MFGRYHRWLYRGGHPNLLARILNRFWAMVHALGIAPNQMVALEVVGRRSGRLTRFPLAMVVLDGDRYLVSMLGKDASWVKNVRAAEGLAVLRHGRVESVKLEEMPVQRRGPILKTYLKRARGARPHMPVDKDASIEEFAAIADQFPVFRVVSRRDD